MVDVPSDLGQRILRVAWMAVTEHLKQTATVVGDRSGPGSGDLMSQQRARRVVIGRAGPQPAGDIGSGELESIPGDPTTDGRLCAT